MTWFEYCIAVLALAAIVYLPAMLLLKGLNFSKSLSVCAAPLVSVPVYSLVAICFSVFDVRATWYLIALPLLICGAASLVLQKTFSRSRQSIIDFGIRPNWPLFAFYVCLGTMFAVILYAIPLGHPESFVQGNDIAHHLNQIKASLDSGNWSMLAATLDPDVAGTFYPSVWALWATIIVDAIPMPVAMASNITNFFTLSIVFPVSMYLFFSAVFKGRPQLIALGALCSMLFFCMPWQLLMRSALLYPNLVGMALLPAFLGATIAGVNSTLTARQSGARISVAPLCITLIGLVAIGCAHPNTVFSAYVMLVPFVAWRLYDLCKQKPRSSFVCLGVVAAFCIGCVAMWLIAMRAPFLEGIVSYPYGKSRGLLDSFAANLAFYSSYAGAQYILGLIVLAGLVYAAMKKEYRWLAASYGAVFAICTLNLALPDCEIKHILSGFWYNHPVRLAAMKALLAMPLAALGFYSIGVFIARLLKRDAIRKNCVYVVAVACSLLIFALPVPLPKSGTLVEYFTLMQDYNDANGSKSFFTSEEQDFVKNAVGDLDSDIKILNVPHDGSAFSYALERMNVSFRSFYASELSDGDMGYFVQYLDKIDSDVKVQQVAINNRIGYVLRLDSAKDNKLLQGSTVYNNRFDIADWSGVYRLQDDTPGFELLFSEGDMRLYRIKAVSG